MRVNTINKRISIISDNLKDLKDLYRCVCFLEFSSDTEYYLKYKVYKKDRVIKEYIYDVDSLQEDNVPEQIKKDYNCINKIELADMDYLSKEQIEYFLNDREANNGGNV